MKFLLISQGRHNQHRKPAQGGASLAPWVASWASILYAFILVWLPSPLGAADSVVVFNEIHYHPLNENNDTEWIELRSLMGVNVDMSGWKLEGGVNYTFAEDTVIPGHGYLLIAADPNHHTLTGKRALGPFTGRLANNGETVRLVNNSDRTMDLVSYGDDGDWPVGADGLGATLSKRTQNTAESRPFNWVASSEFGGTPGSSNFPLEDQPPTVSSILTLSSAWKYRETDTSPALNWKSPSFDDDAWTSGDSVFFAGTMEPRGAGEGLLGYWPLDEGTGNTASDISESSNEASLSGASWGSDETRSSFLTFAGNVGSFGNTGATTIPVMTLARDFTWSFWARRAPGDTEQNSIILGNRFAPNGSDFSPRQFIKFTPSRLEWHMNGQGNNNLEYPDLPPGQWQHHALVKAGSTLTYFRNGTQASTGSISNGLDQPQPLYFGGETSGGGGEFFNGSLDDPAIWEKALPSSSIAGLAGGTLTPLTAPTIDGGGGGDLGSELTLGATTYYFRHDFIFNGNPARTTLNLQLLLDDGAIVYLNGTEIHRENMPGGVVNHDTLAQSEIQSASLLPPISLPGSSLLPGPNTIAVEVHQDAPGSSDMTFGALLTATEEGVTPGERDRSIVFSEISAGSDPSFQVEITNISSSAVELTGYQLRSSSGGIQLLPGGFLAPGNNLIISPTFPVSDGHRLALYRPGGIELADAREVTNRLRGLAGDQWLYPSEPSFGAPNSFNLESDIVINEIMYNPRPLPATPPPPPTVLLDWDDPWRFNESGANLGSTWETVAHPVDNLNWLSGPGPLGVENPGVLTHEINTPLSPLASRDPRVLTFYFETEFLLTQQERADITLLELTHQIDDGAIFYLNGVEIERFQMDGEPITSSTTASATVGNAAVITKTLTTSAVAALTTGLNRLSVEVHQANSGSSDVVMGAQLVSTREGIPFRNSNEQWIEFYNKGSSPVDLGGWSLSDGVDFEFPSGTTLNNGEFLIVARDADSLASKFPEIDIAGQWNGSLSRKGERLRLIDASKNPVDEVRFYDGGRWPEAADGGGSSLELRDPDSDNSTPEAWAGSLKSGAWQTINYSGRGSRIPSNDPDRYNEFIFGLLDAGEFLIDDISVIENPTSSPRQLIQNGTFSGGDFDRWRMRGNHRRAEVIDDPENPGNKVLHVHATGAMEHMHNHAETTLKDGNTFVNINSSSPYEISFRAKWLGGSNQLNTRLYFNRLPRTTILDAPLDGGTPGAPNSQQLANAGPTFRDLSHTPAVPAANRRATVTVQASDPDEVASMTVFYSVDGGNFASISMTDRGEGRYSATIPGQSGGRKVQFYVAGRDRNGGTSFIPRTGPDSHAIIPWDDGQANLDYGDCQPNNFRIVMTNADRDFLHRETEVMSNDRIGCTIIYNESEIYYNCGVRLKGSQRGRNKPVRVGFNVRFPDDQPFLGAHSVVAVDRSGAGDQFSQKEMLVKHIVSRAGNIPGMNDDLIRVIAPRSAQTGSAMLLKSKFDDEWLENQFPDGDEGTMFEYELIYYPTSTAGGGPEDLKRPNPDSVAGVSMRSISGRRNKELYRYHWQIDNNKDADDYEPLIEMLIAMGLSGNSYRDATNELLDVDQWLRSFAVQVLCGIGDNYSSGSQHNAVFYFRPSDGKALYFPWDMDFSFNRGATSGLTPNGDLDKLLAASPANERAYYGHILDIVNTSFNSAYINEWIDHYQCFLTGNQPSLSTFRSYINTRSRHAANLINNAVTNIPYRINTPDGMETNQSFITVSGDGWVDVREIRFSGGGALPITWTDNNSWEVTVPISPGANTITLEAVGFDGVVISRDSVDITGSSTLAPATAANFAITEFNYHPGPPTADEQIAGFLDSDAFEFIEMQNLSETQAIDLTNLAFTNGITFNFPSSTLDPGARVIVAGNEAAFIHRYGGGLPVIGQYQISNSNRLSNDGERLRLEDASGTAISDFTYNEGAPWPSSADGFGYSLVLMCPGLNDPTLPQSWRTSATVNGNANGSDTIDLATWMVTNRVLDLSFDDDGDRSASLLEFATGRDPNIFDATDEVESAIVETDGQLFAAMVFRQQIGADEISFRGESSGDLVNWTDGPLYLGRTNNGDGTSSVWFVSNRAIGTSEREFLRLEITTKP